MLSYLHRCLRRAFRDLTVRRYCGSYGGGVFTRWGCGIRYVVRNTDRKKEREWDLDQREWRSTTDKEEN